MNRSTFDPEELERLLVANGYLREPDPGEMPPAEVGSLEANFTEMDRRLWCLWRIMTVRQLHPSVLQTMRQEDLVFIAGHSPEGYQGLSDGVASINLAENKIAQNAKRAAAELERRSRRASLRQQIALVTLSAVIGAVLALLWAWVWGGDPAPESGTVAAIYCEGQPQMSGVRATEPTITSPHIACVRVATRQHGPRL